MPAEPVETVDRTSTTQGRPTGVTILAVLAALGGVLGILGGLALVGIGGVAVAGGSAGAGGLASILGIVILLLSIAQLFLAYGFWTLKPWAWPLGVGLQVLSVLLAIVQYANNTAGGVVGLIISLAISGVILYYLFQPHVKAAFGRA